MMSYKNSSTLSDNIKLHISDLSKKSKFKWISKCTKNTKIYLILPDFWETVTDRNTSEFQKFKSIKIIDRFLFTFEKTCSPIDYTQLCFLFFVNPKVFNTLHNVIDFTNTFGIPIEFAADDTKNAFLSYSDKCNALLAIESLEKKVIREKKNPRMLDVLYEMLNTNDFISLEKSNITKDINFEIKHDIPEIFKDEYPVFNTKIIPKEKLNYDNIMSCVNNHGKIVFGAFISKSSGTKQLMQKLKSKGKELVLTYLMELDKKYPLIQKYQLDSEIDFFMTFTKEPSLKPNKSFLFSPKLKQLLTSCKSIRRINLILTIEVLKSLDSILNMFCDISFKELHFLLPFSEARKSAYPSIIEAAPLVHSALMSYPDMAKKMTHFTPLKHPWLSDKIALNRPDKPVYENTLDFNKKPLISVVIPCYQKADTISLTLNALINQDLPKEKYEIILIDDGSSDQTVEISQAVLSSAISRVNYSILSWRRNEERNLGDFNFRTGLCRNLGAEYARGKYLLFLDSDMLSTRNLLQEHLKLLSLGAKVVRGTRIKLDWEAGPYLAKYKKQNTAPSDFSLFPTERIRDVDDPPPTVSWNTHVHPWSLFYTNNISTDRLLFLKLGGFDESYVFWGLEDVELGYRYCRNNIVLHHNDRALAYHVRHHTEFTGKDLLLLQRINFEFMYRKYFDFLFHYFNVLSYKDRQYLKDIMIFKNILASTEENNTENKRAYRTKSDRKMQLASKFHPDFSESLTNEIEEALGVKLVSAVLPKGGLFKNTFIIKDNKQKWIARINIAQKYLIAQQYASRALVPVPKVIASNLDTPNSGSIQWIVEEFINGAEIDFHHMNKKNALIISNILGENLKKLHSIKVDGFGYFRNDVLQGCIDSWEEWIMNELEKIQSAIKLAKLNSNEIALINRAFSFLLNSFQDSAVICHGDYARDNILIKRNKILAVIDWTNAIACDPAHDLAFWLFWNQDKSNFDAFLAGYKSNDLDLNKRINAFLLIMAVQFIEYFNIIEEPKIVKYCQKILKNTSKITF
ncbi:MAG: glycosyltransferase [Pseudomonadota bacterium]